MDNFLPALRLLVLPIIAGTLLLVTLRWSGAIPGLTRSYYRRPFMMMALALFLWGLLQQYALQAFINRRAQMLWGQGTRSILFVGIIFSLLHLPNCWLALATLAGDIVWATIYQRAPNLFALALSHAVMTVVLVSTVPDETLHGMRVGFNYYY